MQVRKEYIIQFAGLNLGSHEYEFKITDSFFENFNFSEIKHANICVKLKLVKQSQLMVLHFEVSGTVKSICDLCANEFDFPIHGLQKLIVKIGGNDTGDKDDDIITIGVNDHELDLSTHIYEYIVLSLPIKRVHPVDKKGNGTCDKEMLNKLDNFLIKGSNEEIIDPRWDNLKKINLN